MNKSLRRRVEMLESRTEPVWIPLRLICPVLDPREFEPGERIVSDELVDGTNEVRPLVINVQADHPQSERPWRVAATSRIIATSRAIWNRLFVAARDAIRNQIGVLQKFRSRGNVWCMNQPHTVSKRLLRIRFSVGGKRHELKIPLPFSPVSRSVDSAALQVLPEGKSRGLPLVPDLAQVTEPGGSRME